MNSEELELSLRTEFESYLRTISADLRQEISELQMKFDSEIARHKLELDQLMQTFSGRVAADRQFDANFKDVVVEHLRLARDEGARITATAFAEAEQMAKATADHGSAGAVNQIRKAIFDISTKNTQSAILKSLVQYASNFTPRGIFFVVKNDQLVGWKCFGTEQTPSEDVVRNISFPANQKTTPGTAVQLLSSVDSNFDSGEGDQVYLHKLGFGRPDKMYAIPLLVRGRAVAVVYADHGTTGGSVDVDALETIVRVAGLTVEILAAGRSERPREDERSVAAEESAFERPAPVPSFNSAPAMTFEPVAPTTPSFESRPDYSFEPAPETSTPTNTGYGFDSGNQFQATPAWSEPAPPPTPFTPSPSPAPSTPAPTYEFEPNEVGNGLGTRFNTTRYESPTRLEPTPAPVQPVMDETPQFAPPVESYPAAPTNFSVPAAAPVQVQATSTAPAKSRFSDRSVDLPIEVPEEERRDHNNARRFARLLVSEIKLYNPERLKEGRQERDIYDRLHDAIDRSRKMYDERVKQPVAGRFDYFHYELVSDLAEGDESKLGPTYPGSRR